MPTILKKISKEIWTQDGNISTASPYNSPVIQNGLSFWGIVDPLYLTIDSSSLISEAYDVRNTGEKMVQSTVANRPTLITGHNGFWGLTTNTKSLIKSVLLKDLKDMFVVVSNRTISGEGVGIGTLETSPPGLTRLFGSNSNYVASYAFREISSARLALSMYADSSLLSGVTTSRTINKLYSVLHTKNAIHTVGGFLYNVNLAVGGMWAVGSSTSYITEWGWYNRNLNETEIIYNINSLNQKYNYV